MADSERLHKVGKEGRLSLFFKKRQERTILYDSFATMPMQAFQPFYPDDTGCACTYLVNPTGGLVGGDRIDIAITLDECAHVLITTPSANKVYRSTGQFASQSIEITIKRGGVLEYLPGYVIPFAGSLYSQKTRVLMERGATAFVLDAFSTGRVARGESLHFKEYRSNTEIEYDGELILTERMALEPDRIDYSGPGLLEGFSATAVLYLVFDNPSMERPIISALRTTMDEMGAVVGGVSTLPARGVVVRLLGENARIVEKTLFRLWSVARRHILAIEDSFSITRFLGGYQGG